MHNDAVIYLEKMSITAP